MANMNHALAIPGYIILLLVLWGWLPLFVICWTIRKITHGGTTTPEEEAQQFPRPAPGWLGPGVEVSAASEKPLSLLRAPEPQSDKDRIKKRKSTSKAKRDNGSKNHRSTKEMEEWELGRRALAKRRKRKQAEKRLELERAERRAKAARGQGDRGEVRIGA